MRDFTSVVSRAICPSAIALAACAAAPPPAPPQPIAATPPDPAAQEAAELLARARRPAVENDAIQWQRYDARLLERAHSLNRPVWLRIDSPSDSFSRTVYSNLDVPTVYAALRAANPLPLHANFDEDETVPALLDRWGLTHRIPWNVVILPDRSVLKVPEAASDWLLIEVIEEASKAFPASGFLSDAGRGSRPGAAALATPVPRRAATRGHGPRTAGCPQRLTMARRDF